MFSKAYYDEILCAFEKQMTLLRDRDIQLAEKETQLPEEDKGLCSLSRKLLEKKIEEIQNIVIQCSQDEREALYFLYSAMPVSDLLDYPASLYLAYARHGVFLWKEGPFAGKVPEKLFANYVLHHRVHNEDIADTRSFFYERLKDRTAGKEMYDAVLETNRWCAEKATYKTTYPRTQNPVTMYHTAVGRCGEEAPFAVTALRSLGIPAREAAAPWWSHCDDNHAWVEAWCDGRWHFFGACEPESSLDSGWFVTSASRAMLVDSTWFGKDAPLEPAADRQGMSVRLNHLALYARTIRLTVRVVDESGRAVPGARVEFAVLNYGKFNTVARLYTEDAGVVEFDTGYGDLLVCAGKEECYGEAFASLTKENECTVVVKKGFQELNQWREADFHAPKARARNEKKTDAQAASEQAWLEAAARSRQRRVQNFYQEEEAKRVLARFEEQDRGELCDILRKACGNMGQIVRFLEWDFGGCVAKLEEIYGRERWRLRALLALRENDYWDISAEILAECSICASPYAAEYPEEIFFSSLWNPCAAFEKASACRVFLEQSLSAELKDQIRANPGLLPAMLDELMDSLPDQEYANLVTSPVGCLTGGIGSAASRAVLCVNLYRALGVPARLRPMDRKVEYYEEGGFAAAGKIEKKTETAADAPAADKSPVGGKVILRMEKPFDLKDWKHYSLARFEEGHFVPMFLRPPKDAGQEDVMELSLEPGIYRAVTTNRVPNGNQLVRICDFDLRENECRQLTLSVREISEEAMLEHIPVKDFELRAERTLTRTCPLEENGAVSREAVRLSGLSREGKALLIWLELTREPTEHILNEIKEKKEAFGNLETPVCFVVPEGMNYREDPTLKLTLEALPKIRVLTDCFGEEYDALSDSVGCNPGQLPLVLVLERGSCIYADCGYNVGTADLLLKILS